MHIPRKRFGQHFLHDDIIIKRIIAALRPENSDHLIEIGPGEGALTFPILKQTKQLEAIELDRDLIPYLADQAKQFGHLQIYANDVLKFDFNSLKHDQRLLRIFGNLPYNISTPLLFHLLTFSPIISDMLFMLQKEVAERIAAPANSEHFGRLSVMMQYYCQIEFLFTVPADAFRPPPQVTSAIIRLTPYRDYPLQVFDKELFATVVRHAFGQRRKTLRNSLKSLVDDTIWEEVSIHSDLRAENLSVEDFVKITNALQKKLGH